MGRRIAECGTWSAYKRHKRRGEEACDACKKAAVEQSRKQRERAAQIKIQGFDGETVSVSQIVAYGQSIIVPVPATENPLESARWRLHRVRAALLVASPRDVASLSDAEAKCIAEVERLTAESSPAKESVLDQLANKRAERLANAAG